MATATINFRHQDYTVAWLCALPLEMAAAEAMLDEKHPKLPTKPTDDNTYILGRIYDHNIVIACLRSGVYGTTSAATLATQMQSTFQSIRFFLMVGIGGGAPSEKVDIRLGDVVVSNPTRDFGGVIQYDYGKTVSGGRFERTGVLNKPLPVLLTAVSRLKAAHLSMPNKIPTLLSEMLARNPMMRKSFTYRGADQDLLFDSEYDHCGSENTCDNCDNTRLVTRPARLTYDPIIHYGLIASGNQVVKHGRTRDKLAREIGILCFEMEAAGLMDDFQCLVIRGICDYSDSHKNKQWQQYAAATAAAYAKELLSVVHTSQVADTPPPRSDLSYYNGKLPFGGEHATSVTVHRNDDQDYETLLEQISSYDYRKVHRRLSQKRLVDTTQWFLDHPDFQAWFTDKSISTLWCSGKIGSGKTMIATAVVEAALYRYSENRSPTVFFYCENEYHRSLDGSYILSSCIKQLCDFLHTTSRPYPEDVKTEIRKFFGPKPIQPDFEDLKYIFNRLFHSVPDAVYIIDGLDVLSQNHGKALLGLIQSLFCFSRPPQGSRILLLSRDQVPGYINIATFMPGIRQISTSGNVMEDIESYIEASIIDKTMCRKLTDDAVLVEDIKRTLLTKSSGMFLWVHLQLEILWDTCYTDAGIRSALATLPKGLEETYGRCIDRINLQDSYALKVLKWVSFGTRSLHIDELREAVSFDLGDTGWIAEKIPQKDVVIGCCANLIVIDPTDNCVRFAHHSVKQYLDKYQGREVQAKRIREYPNTEQGDLECGELCVTYLSFSDFSLQLSKQSTERAAIAIPQPALLARPVLRLGLTKPLLPLFRKKNQCIPVPFRTIRTMSTPDRTRYRFLDYAVTNWALHTKQIPHTSVVWDKFKALATCFNETWNFHPWVPGGRSKDSHLHGLFGWAVKEPHERLLSIALAAGPVLQRVCDLPLVGERLPALHVASKLGYRGIVEILLDFCNVNVSDEEGYTALHHAANRGHIEICRLLLSANSVKVNAVSKSLCTPLWLAASNGHREVVSLLVEHQSNIEAKGSSLGQTALSLAARNGHYRVVELLLEKGADLESKDTGGRTPLSWAVKCRHEAIMKLLLEKGAEPKSQDIDVPSLVLWASEHGHEVAMSMLSIHFGQLDFEDYKNRASLSWAAENGYEVVVKLLVNKGVYMEAKDYLGRTPLFYAIENRHEAVIKLLIDGGANLEAKNNFGQTPLFYAIENRHHAVIKLLIDGGADLEAKNNFGQTPLFYAIENRHHAVIELLIDGGADLESKDNFGRTPLFYAARNGHETVVKLLIGQGADLDAKDDVGRTPLFYAARNGHETVVKLLIDQGADLDAKDNFGRTPLFYAARNGHEAVVKLLIDQGADLDAKDNIGETPLVYAARNGHETVVKLLIDQGADLDAKNHVGETPLIYAAKNGYEIVVKLLIDRGAYLDTKNSYSGRTPLSWAAGNGYEAVVKLLIDKGADRNAKDRDGQKPLSFAARQGHDVVVEFLRSHDTLL